MANPSPTPLHASAGKKEPPSRRLEYKKEESMETNVCLESNHSGAMY
jgi:hypothetical protein